MLVLTAPLTLSTTEYEVNSMKIQWRVLVFLTGLLLLPMLILLPISIVLTKEGFENAVIIGGGLFLVVCGVRWWLQRKSQ